MNIPKVNTTTARPHPHRIFPDKPRNGQQRQEQPTHVRLSIYLAKRGHTGQFSPSPSQSLSRRYNIITWRSLPFQPCCSSANQIRSGLGSTCDTTITCARACENTSFTHASARTVNLPYCTVPEDYPKTLFPCRGIYDCEAL